MLYIENGKSVERRRRKAASLKHEDAMTVGMPDYTTDVRAME